jgi:hypothetical protein
MGRCAARSSDVETAVRTCLVQNGWKVDEVGSYAGGSNVVTAYKAKDQTDVYIHDPDQKPRITGGPDDGNPFWKCLGGELGGGGAAKDQDKDQDKEKEKDDPADKPPSK